MISQVSGYGGGVASEKINILNFHHIIPHLPPLAMSPLYLTAKN